MAEQEYIPLDQCVDRGVYRLWSRNLRVGVFDARTGDFTGIRSKWGERFLDEEWHWDKGEPHGTAKPIKKIGDLPTDIPFPPVRTTKNEELFNCLKSWFDESTPETSEGVDFLKRAQTALDLMDQELDRYEELTDEEEDQQRKLAVSERIIDHTYETLANLLGVIRSHETRLLVLEKKG